MHPADAVYQIDHGGHRIHDRRSPLKKILDRTELNNLQSVTACPYGCKPRDQDRLGYCRHLIGFCEHPKLKDGVVKALPKKPIIVELLNVKPDRDGRRSMSDQREPLQIGDFVLRIVSTLRVYRKPADEEAGAPDAEDWGEDDEPEPEIRVEHNPDAPYEPEDAAKNKRAKRTA